MALTENVELTRRFTYHAPNPQQPEVYRLLRDVGLLLALVVEASAAPSREASLALTAIEEAVMWANAAVARNGLVNPQQTADRRLQEVALLLAKIKPNSDLTAALDPASLP